MTRLFILCVAAISITCINTSAQGRIALTAGLGVPELLNAGLRYGKGQSQFALTVGTIPSQEEESLSLSGDFYRHFGGKAKLTERKPWFVKLGLNYLKSESPFLIEKYGYLNFSIGREFNLTEHLGVQFHGGTIFQFHESVIEKQPSYGFDIDISFPVLPCLGIATFYKF